jgi:hypothetical protein
MGLIRRGRVNGRALESRIKVRQRGPIPHGACSREIGKHAKHSYIYRGMTILPWLEGVYSKCPLRHNVTGLATSLRLKLGGRESDPSALDWRSKYYIESAFYDKSVPRDRVLTASLPQLWIS